MTPADEYQSLRDELRELGTRQITLLTFSVTVSVALLTFVIDGGSQRALLALTPLIILAITSLQIINIAYATIRIASYIAYFLEPEQQGWENRMRQWRHLTNSDITRSFPTYQLVPIIMGMITISIAFLLTFKLPDERTLPFTICSVVALVWLVFSWYFHTTMRQAVSGKLDDSFQRIWEKIAKPN